MTSLAVIIPYYQENEGILRRALYSVRAQNLPPDLNVVVIVVDDGSPVPAKKELADLSLEAPFRLDVAKQANAGVGAARNAGLDRVSTDANYIAFLDSDDAWPPDHLATAVAALQKGRDFYFCDNRRTGGHDSNFLTHHDHHLLEEMRARLCDDGVYEIDRDIFFDVSVHDLMTQLSTVVFRRDVASDLRFHSGLRTAGEDQLYILQVATRCRRLCCSADDCVTCGNGVNIYFSSLTWDTPQHMSRFMDGLLALYEMKKLPLNCRLQRHVSRRIKLLRRTFAFLTLRFFVKHRAPWTPELRRTLRQDPSFWSWYPFCVLYTAALFPLRLYSPLKE